MNTKTSYPLAIKFAKNFSLCALIALNAFQSDISAQFSNSGLSMINSFNSAVSWVDVDGDGDLDASVSGDDLFLSAGQGKLYVFESNAINSSMDIAPIEDGDMLWCDFTNDNIPDLLYAGEATGLVAGIDTFNSDGAITYATYYSEFTLVDHATTAWGDYDNDGDYDILLSGENASGEVISTLYRNNNGTFEDVEARLPGVINGRTGFIDYDLDCDLDIFICGEDRNQNTYTRLWENNNGTYTVTNDLFTDLKFSSYGQGDFNGDGYPDIILQGDDGNNTRGLMYINNKGAGFYLSDTIIPSSKTGNSGFGDVDNDGDLDAIVSGNKYYPSLNQKPVYYNNGTDSLVADPFTISYIVYTDFQFGDYDNDNDLDFIVNGMNASNQGVTLVVDNEGSANTPPSAPAILNAEVIGTKVKLSWDHSTDNNTPQKSLNYNIYVGTTSQGTDVVSPHAEIPGGFRKIASPGYIQDTAWVIKNLSAGTYYWGVQAIDNALGTSSFSIQDTFEIKNRFSELSFEENPKATSPAIYFDADHDNDYDMFLTGTNEFLVAENTPGGFAQANYDTILDNAFNPVHTITPNDYDNNNRIDFSVSGDFTTDGLLDSSIALFSYDSALSYTLTDSALSQNTAFQYVLWADFDNDGLQDFITSGHTTNLAPNKPITYIYKNLGGGAFQNMAHNIRGFDSCGAAAADFDNDMDIDIIIYGIDSTGMPNTYLYLNNGNFSFTEQLIPNNELFRRFLYFGIYPGDYDLDGEPDIYLTGQEDNGNVHARVLLNNGLTFTNANLGLKSWKKASNFWTDYDYDGDLDILTTSVFTSPDEVRLHKNSGQTLDEESINLGAAHELDLPFMAANLDNKNGADFVMKENLGDYMQFYDNYATRDTLSAAPENLSHDLVGSDAILSWEKLAGCPGCTYNIRVGTEPGGTNIFSPMADTATGYRYVVQPGNTSQNNAWKISGLDVGTYYWSVQAIDLAYTGGPWSEEQSFEFTFVNADFTFDTVCLGDTTTFTDKSSSIGDPVSNWNWDFGDGSSSTAQHPKHAYSTAGNYSVTLTARTSADSATRTREVYVKPAPVASFSVEPVCLGETSQLINLSDTTQINVKNWLWDFGNGETSGIRNSVSKTYTHNTTASLTIDAENGCSDSTAQPIIVATVPDARIQLDSGSTTSCTGDTVYLSNIESDTNYSYIWMQGDIILSGENSNTLKVSNPEGTYEYSIEVTNTLAACSDSSGTVTLNFIRQPDKPIFDPEIDTLRVCPQEVITLVPVDTSAQFSYSWIKNGTQTIHNFAAINKILDRGDYVLHSINQGCENLSDVITIEHLSELEQPVLNIFGPNVWYLGCKDTVNPKTWYYNGEIIENETGHMYMVNRNFGVYQVSVTDDNGCRAFSDTVSIPSIDYKTGNLYARNGIVRLYPNPNNGQFTFEFEDSYTGKIEIELLNNAAQTIEKNIYNKQGAILKTDVNISGSKEGIYHLILRTKKEEIVREFIIK